MTTTQPLFEIVKTTLGVTSIRNNVVNEIMHNPVGPWDEANLLYIEQSNFRQLLRQGREFTSPFTIFDVGLGAAANAIAALHAYSEESKKQTLPALRIISYEIDLRLLYFTIDHAHHFPQLKPYKEAIENLLEKHIWRSNNIEWILREGDFTDLIHSETNLADLIFYDAYSPKVNNEMWTYSCFKDLYSHCQNSSTRSCSLYTYSRSTPIRSALLSAGFFVGQGVATGLKSETTQASTQLKSLSAPLGEQWLGRWNRSCSPLPIDHQKHPEIDLKQSILLHPQFKQLSN